MKRGGKIALGIVGALAVTGAGVAAWQWNNISALRYGMTMDRTAIEEKLAENEQTLASAMEEYSVSSYTFSEEELRQLSDGTLSVEEAAKKLLDESVPGAEAPEGSSGQQTAEKSDVEAQIQEQIAQMYVLRSTYVSKLEAIAQAAIDEYTQGEHTEENKADVVYKRLEELTALEKECDAQVAQVVEQLRSLLKQAGKDDSLAQQVEKTYQEEKSLKKAAYLEEFRNGWDDGPALPYPAGRGRRRRLGGREPGHGGHGGAERGAGHRGHAPLQRAG